MQLTFTQLSCAVLSVLVMFCPLQTQASSAITERKSSLRANVETDAFQSEFKNAVGEVLGCGGERLERDKAAAIEKILMPMWQTLPKNTKGRVERRMLRYLAHRYFMQTSSIVLRGFEPSRPVNESSWGSADILSQQVPVFVESILESQHAKDRGFDLHDAVYVVAMLERLIVDSDSALLEVVYAAQRKPTDRTLSRNGLEQVLEEYLLRWLMGDDAETIQRFLDNRHLLWRTFPHWEKLVGFANGQLRAMDFQRQRSPKDFTDRNANYLSHHYSLDDARKVVASITMSFASFWESECTAMKTKLLEMDTHQTGRVPLSKFYSRALDQEWRFGESEAYLRELGALDETSRWHGKQVIIPNYIAAASNCMVATPHYKVCCVDPCESLLGEIEVAVGAAVATPQEILSLVRNMSAQTTLDDAGEPHLSGSLTRQLEQMASMHGGKVPLHGRLFGQWLHYAFPRDCPFPHKMGTATALTPSEFGNGYIVTEGDRQIHASSDTTPDMTAKIDKDESEWMSQWSSDEELLSDYNNDLQAPWERNTWLIAGTAILVVAGLLGVVDMSRKAAGSTLLPMHGKTHFV